MDHLPVGGVRLSLWRAAAVYRVATLLACLYLIFFRWRDLYALPAVAELTGVGMAIVTAGVVWAAWTGRAHHLEFVVADVVVTAGLTLLTILAQTALQRHGGMTTLTTLWAAGPALEAGIVAGWLGGLLAALVQTACSVVVRGGYDGRTVWNGVTLVVAGAVVGYVSALAVRSEAELASAVTARAAVRERERLARSVHDGVLQILALVHRTGRDDPGEWGRLAREAGAQEAQLRALITSVGTDATADDLGTALRALRSDRVTVSTPAQLPSLAAHTVAEIAAAVRSAVQNTAQHAGAQAHTWILVEDEESQLRVTVRDDGDGFAAGRLDEARRNGRLGVSASIRGRIEDLGGKVVITAQPGEGTVVEMTVPIR